jgi:hypothetical protein
MILLGSMAKAARLRGYHRQVLGSATRGLRLTAAFFANCWLVAACAADPSAAPPKPWTGFFHPPPKPGASITNGKQCDCRACDPAACCTADDLESTEAAPPECSGSYEFSEKCGIQVRSCTPRCYSHVWRIPKQQSCSDGRPLVCCD